MPGGFTIDAAQPDQARAMNWSRPRGAIYQVRSNYFTIQCLVDSIDGKTVSFNHSVGCDQGGPCECTLVKLLPISSVCLLSWICVVWLTD
jgi:hypothetical protein